MRLSIAIRSTEIRAADAGNKALNTPVGVAVTDVRSLEVVTESLNRIEQADDAQEPSETEEVLLW